MDTDVKDPKFEELSWRVLSSVRYHGRRESFFMICHSAMAVLALTTGSFVFMAGLVDEPLGWWASILGVVVMVLSFTDILVRFGARAALHDELRRRFVHIETKMACVSKDDTARIDRLMKEVLELRLMSLKS